MRAQRAGSVALVVLVGGLTVTGCGSSTTKTSTGSGGSTGPAGSTGSAGGASEIVIGTIGTYSGPLATTLAHVQPVIQAWAKDLNAHGGINGHQVRLIVKDDGGDAAKGQAAAKQLVSQDKVVAIVGETSLVDVSWAPVAASAGVPVIGGQPFNTPFVTNADFFPSGTNSIARTYGEVSEAKKLGGDKLAVLYCAEAPVCATAVPLFKTMGQELAVSVPVAQSVSASAPNYTAACQAVKSSGSKAVHVAQASIVARRILDACVDQGVTATDIATGGIADAKWLPNPKAQGTINIELNAPYFDDSIPATKAYRTLLSSNSLDDSSGGSGTYAYAGGKLFEAAVKGVGGSAVSSESLKTALYGMKDETLGGLSSPLNFVKGHPSLINCWFVSKIDNKQWTTPEGLKTACAPDALVAKVAAGLRGS